MNRFIRFLSAVVPYLAAETIQYVLYSVVLFISSFTAISDNLLYVLSAGVIAICGIIFYYWYRYEIRGEIRGSLKTVLTAKNLTLFLFLGIGSQFFFTGAMSLIKPLFTKVFSDYSNTMQGLTSGNIYVVLLLMIFIAPVTEELIFRGVTLHKANRFINFLGANILQAVFFGIYHGNIVQGIYATLLGFLLGAVYYKYKTIFAPILLHMIINASSLLVVFLPDQSLSYVIITVAGGICIIITLLILKPLRTVILRTLPINLQEDDKDKL